MRFSRTRLTDVLHRVYAGGAYAVPDDLWDRLVGKIEETILTADGSLPVPVLVLASTQPRMDDVELDSQPDIGGPPLGVLLNALGTDRKALLKAPRDGHHAP